MDDLRPDSPKGKVITALRATIRGIRLVILRLKLRKKFSYGENITFGPNSSLMVPEFIKLGSNFSVGRNFFVQTNVKCGNDCLISSDVSFVGHDHHINEAGFNCYWSGRKAPSTITLEGDNFIGYRSTIVGNINVGKGSIIAAGSVVIKDVPEESVVAGIPARIVGKRKR